MKVIRLHEAGVSRSCLIPLPGSYFLRDLWEEGEMVIVLDMVKSECEVRAGRPSE